MLRFRRIASRTALTMLAVTLLALGCKSKGPRYLDEYVVTVELAPGQEFSQTSVEVHVALCADDYKPPTIANDKDRNTYLNESPNDMKALKAMKRWYSKVIPTGSPQPFVVTFDTETLRKGGFAGGTVFVFAALESPGIVSHTATVKLDENRKALRFLVKKDRVEPAS